MDDYKNSVCMDCAPDCLNTGCNGFSREDFPVAMAYVPWQRWNGIYENLEEAFCNGTIFPEMNKPFTGRRCVK